MKNRYHFQSPIGILCIEETKNYITGVHIDRDPDYSQDQKTAVIEQACTELEEYFRGKRKQFTVPLRYQGTEFQNKVWDALRTIPYGETRSYGEIAAQIGNPKACRAVGGANNKNCLLILVPCHRVIGSDGSLVGFGGGIEVKRRLLELEQI